MSDAEGGGSKDALQVGSDGRSVVCWSHRGVRRRRRWDGGGGGAGVLRHSRADIRCFRDGDIQCRELGPDHVHEFVVVKTDLAPDALPTTEEGAVDEEGEGVELIGEIEEIPVGETSTTEFDLEPGSYVLFCNLVVEEEGEVEAHYSEGMRVGFTVEG